MDTLDAAVLVTRNKGITRFDVRHFSITNNFVGGPANFVASKVDAGIKIWPPEHRVHSIAEASRLTCSAGRTTAVAGSGTGNRMLSVSHVGAIGFHAHRSFTIVSPPFAVDVA